MFACWAAGPMRRPISRSTLGCQLLNLIKGVRGEMLFYRGCNLRCCLPKRGNPCPLTLRREQDLTGQTLYNEKPRTGILPIAKTASQHSVPLDLLDRLPTRARRMQPFRHNIAWSRKSGARRCEKQIPHSEKRSPSRGSGLTHAFVRFETRFSRLARSNRLHAQRKRRTNDRPSVHPPHLEASRG